MVLLKLGKIYRNFLAISHVDASSWATERWDICHLCESRLLTVTLSLLLTLHTSCSCWSCITFTTHIWCLPVMLCHKKTIVFLGMCLCAITPIEHMALCPASRVSNILSDDKCTFVYAWLCALMTIRWKHSFSYCLLVDDCLLSVSLNLMNQNYELDIL